jgi:Ca2+-binding EF-hand superfamily protein
MPAPLSPLGGCCTPTAAQKMIVKMPLEPQISSDPSADTLRNEEAKAAALWRQEVSRTLSTLVGQQQNFWDQLQEVSQSMKVATDQREAIKQNVIAEIRNTSASTIRELHVLSTSHHHHLATKPLEESQVVACQADAGANCGTGGTVGPIDPDSPRPANEAVQPTGSTTCGDVARSASKGSTSTPPKAGKAGGLLGISAHGGSQLELPSDGKISPASFMVFLRSIVDNERFEVGMTLLILGNAIVMTFGSQYSGFDIGFNLQYPGYQRHRASETWPGADIAFQALDWCFGLIFLIEAIMKMSVFKLQYFWGCWSVLWNWLDFACVLAFLVSKIASSFLPIDAQALRLLRLIRLIRLLRILRSLEALDVLYIMATAIRGLGRILLWAVVLLALLQCACALFLTQFLHASYFVDVSAANLSPAELEMHQKLFEYFGTFTRCVLSMFELTLANWPPVTRLLSEEVSEWFMFFCLVHKLTIGFAVMGVITGVILQETFKVAATDDYIMVRQKKRTADVTKKKMTQLFNALDTQGDGELELEEFESIAQDPEVKTWLASMDIETDDLECLFRLIDFDNSGSIGVEEMIQRIPRIKGAARSIDVLVMRTKLNEVMGMVEKLLGLKQQKLDRVNLGGSYKVVPNANQIGQMMDRNAQ